MCVCVCEGAVPAGATPRAGVTTESDTQRGGTAETRQSRGNFSTYVRGGSRERLPPGAAADFMLLLCVKAIHSFLIIPSVLLLVGQQEGHPACKKWGAGVVIFLERGADLHVAQLMPLPLTVSRFSKIQTGFTFLVPAHLGR